MTRSANVPPHDGHCTVRHSSFTFSFSFFSITSKISISLSLELTRRRFLGGAFGSILAMLPLHVGHVFAICTHDSMHSEWNTHSQQSNPTVPPLCPISF